MFEIVLLAALFLYVADIFWLQRGLLRCFPFQQRFFAEQPSSVPALPFVTVVVAARNEEKNILPCIESLSRLEYPHDKIEIIIVDDRSTDTTSGIVSTFIASLSHFKLLRITQEGKQTHGKANALAVALDEARGEIFMFTDADCTVSPLWVKTTAEQFQNDVGIVGSYTLLTARNTFEGIQSLDWLMHFTVSAAMAGHQLPITVIGNNFSISKKAYNAVGGFRGIPFSVTEDYALVQAVLKTKKYNVRFLVSDETLIRSYPCATWKEIYRQKQRWGVGALDMVSEGIIVIGIGYVAHLLFLFGFFFSSLPFLLSLFGIKFLADIFLLRKPLSEFRGRTLLKHFLAFEVYYYVYGLIFPLIVLFTKKVTWKERKF
ncbi:MAG: glycosyltransferase [Ignavibacteriales bacterium]|nr:glycosyltransferase [Ignavibacteriales bacterium]